MVRVVLSCADLRLEYDVLVACWQRSSENSVAFCIESRAKCTGLVEPIFILGEPVKFFD